MTPLQKLRAERDALKDLFTKTTYDLDSQNQELKKEVVHLKDSLRKQQVDNDFLRTDMERLKDLLEKNRQSVTPREHDLGIQIKRLEEQIDIIRRCGRCEERRLVHHQFCEICYDKDKQQAKPKWCDWFSCLVTFGIGLFAGLILSIFIPYKPEPKPVQEATVEHETVGLLIERLTEHDKQLEECESGRKSDEKSQRKDLAKKDGEIFQRDQTIKLLKMRLEER